MRNVIFIVLLFFSFPTIYAQNFQKLIGNTSDNRFGKEVFHVDSYYILGKNGSKATVTKLDLNGNHIWSNETNEEAYWNDILVNKDGNLMLVGSYGSNSNSFDNNCLVGVCDTNTGAFNILKTYNLGFRELFFKMYENPVPSNVSFPYYVTGSRVVQSGSDSDDLLILNFDNSFNLKEGRIFEIGSQNEELYRDIFIGGQNGAFMTIGNRTDTNSSNTGSTSLFDKNMNSIQRRTFNQSIYFTTGLSNTNPTGGFYQILAGGTSDGSQDAIILRINGSTFNYSYKLPFLKVINKIDFGNANNIYAVGVATIGGIDKTIVLKFQDNGNSLTVLWAKVLDQNETAFSNGFIDYNLALGKLIYTDSRNGNAAGNGNYDGLICVEDENLNNCLTDSMNVVLNNNPMTLDTFPLPFTSFFEPATIDRTGTSLSYQIQMPCAPPCNIALQVNKSVDACSNASFTGIASGGTGPYSYQWDISCDGVNGTTNPYTTPIGPGTIPFCVTVTDAVGCTAVLTNQTVVGVRDLVKPEIICPDDVQLTNNPGECFATFAPIITVTDNCDPTPTCTCVMTGATTGNMIKNILSQFNVGVTNITCTATDAFGNTSLSCTFNVIVLDGQVPTIQCPPNITLSCLQNENDLALTGQAIATDNCPDVSIVYSDQFSGTTCSGIITRTWTATDAAGAKVTCVQLIKKEDKVAPTISCPAFITINCEQQPLPSLTGMPQIMDNCQQSITPTYTDNIIGTGCDRYIQRVWSANDGCDNLATCTQNIYFNDDIAPSISIPEDISVSCSALPSIGTPSGTDNCDVNLTFSFVENRVNGTCPHTYNLIRTWTATDDCGNSSSKSQTITITDNSIPVLVGVPLDITLTCNAPVPSNPFVSASDNCDGNVDVVFSEISSIAMGGCPKTITRTWTATDDCGNSISKSYNIVILCCENSCQGLATSLIPVTMPEGKCCYSLNVNNGQGPAATDGVCIDMLTPDWLINTISVSTGSGFTYSGSNCIEHSGGIPLGLNSNIATICLAETSLSATSPQSILISWTKDSTNINCFDTLVTNCPPPVKKDTCFAITNIKVSCDPEDDYGYCVCMDVKNLSAFNAYRFEMAALPAGYMYANCPGASGLIGSSDGLGGWYWNLPPLATNATTTICFKIVSDHPVVAIETIYTLATIEGLSKCCHSPKPVCFMLEPCCDPCDNVNVKLTSLPNQDSCCYRLDVDYGCDYKYFDKVELDLLTPGVNIGSFTMLNTAWSPVIKSPGHKICFVPTSGYLSESNDGPLVQFCMTDIDKPTEVPQLISINYYNGGEIPKCDTVIKLECKNVVLPCMIITNKKVVCDSSGKYIVTMDVKNNSSSPTFTATEFIAYSFSGGSITPSPIVFSPALAPGQTQTVTFCYSTVPFPSSMGEVIFTYKMRNDKDCCGFSEEYRDTLPLPDCGQDCGYFSCRDPQFSFDVEGRPLGALTAPVNLGIYPGLNKPTIVKDGCIGTQSVELRGATRGYSGESVFVEHGGFVGPDLILQKDSIHCLTFCHKYFKGLAGTTATIEIYSESPYELIGYKTFTNPGVWEETSIMVMPTSDKYRVYFRNITSDPLDVPGTVRLDNIRIGKKQFIKDITPPVINCPPSLTVSPTIVPCTYVYTIPSISASDDSGILFSMECYIDGNLTSMGTAYILGAGIHTVKCIASDTCGNVDSCSYDIKVDCNQPICKCGGFSKTKFCLLSTGTAVETECDLPTKVYNLPCPGTSLVNFCGTFKCSPDTCSPPAVNFALVNSNTGTTIHTANLTLNAMGKFTINLLPGWCNDPSVVYEIRVSGVCGTDTCVCKIRFKVNCPQQNNCKCDPKFNADVAQGFLQSSVVGNCIRKFEPRSLCPSDKVEWYRNGVLVSTTSGMSSSTFPVSIGFGDVCMIVTRTESPNVVCRDTFCSRTYCKPEVGDKCSEIDNSEMVNNIDGYIDDDGAMTNWTKDEGWPYAFANEGLSDGNIMLIASKDMPSAARTNRNGAPPKEGFLTFELDVESYLSTSIPEGTSLELEGVTSTGQRILLSNVDVAGIKKGWDGRIKREISMPEDIYSIVLRLKTSSANPVLLRMDNFCLYSTVGINDIQNEINFSIYPNPTTGQLTIQFSSSVEQDISLKVLDILGRQVNNGLIQKGSSNYNFSIDNLAGIYIIQLTDSDGNMSQRKVIKME